MKPFREVYKCDSVTLNVTNDCNLACVYCFEKDKDCQTMTPKVAIDAVDLAYNEPVGENFFMVNFFGGEPLMAWDTIEAVINHIQEKKYKARVGITTNLTLLTDHMIDVIEEHEVFILVSLDGTKDTHDRNRCNSYDIVVENLKKLVDRRLTYLIEVRPTISATEVHDLSAGVRSIVEMGINNISPCLVTDMEWNMEQYATLQTELYKVYDYYLDILNDKNNKRNISIKIVDDYIVGVLEPIILDTSMCPIGSNRWCAIGPKGDITPCHQQHTVASVYEDVKVGNIYTGVDETKIGQKLSAKFELERCKDCIAIASCKGGCPSQNLIETGDYQTPTEVYCITSRILAQVAKEYQEVILKADNIRPRRLNVLKLNLQAKKYFDEVLCETDILSPDFEVVIAKFQEYMSKGHILPNFEFYFIRKLTPLHAFYLAAKGGDNNAE